MTAREPQNAGVSAAEIVINVIGWMGTGLLLGAYALLTTGRLAAGTTFQVMNLLGGVLLLLNSGYYGAWPSVGLNLAWVTIGTAGLVRARLGRGGRLTG